jgi:hypothetical protein
MPAWRGGGSSAMTPQAAGSNFFRLKPPVPIQCSLGLALCRYCLADAPYLSECEFRNPEDGGSFPRRRNKCGRLHPLMNAGEMATRNDELRQKLGGRDVLGQP